MISKQKREQSGCNALYEHQVALQAGDESYSAQYFIISGITIINVYIWN